ncbi:DUF4123 domain-containing protein [Chromobacterium haemolyticum]|uniref:DUF4123 domain-containing protein n=1 Tax=Chromobacterium haemolyticum TaxID=394935 RepID=UPI0002EF813D|nr:DUF4123 domain-containing protein [Chromobacterium haemolyticum]
MSPAILLAKPSMAAWLELLLEQAQQAGLEWLDFIVDQGDIGDAWQSRAPAMHMPRSLLLETPHAEAADEGPALLRLPLHSPGGLEKWARQLDKWQGEPRLLALLGDWDFDALAERLSACLQASWDQGRQQGVLRFNDPRVFAAVSQTLEPAQRRFLLEPALQWHWLDRDGNARCLVPDAEAVRSWPLWEEETLSLSPSQIDELMVWHQAESWRQDHLLTPSMYGLSSQEELMERLTAAHRAADRAKLWSEPERQPLIERRLREPV